ncbi:PREDICTED: mediator of RNA polymerase II transcription subunit 26-like [Elephantulus edwardii]|uniref:mediator of RNA polymerase II transcription subunit 26-like n=1 Tax=Elephantulus edwardii TaxID=28737 RepID=UPI0003F0D829|nr:PREDICTED: mediator of RNA polymerase II transcription subunit 26-like [Elephantulus edwardii]
MAAALESPQQIRDRLLQAIDAQSNIRNMVAVLEVISSLEKYPITKEALEETRLGKLINDVRKKTKNEELAKRARKLLRSWQKFIEPVHQGEAALRGLPGTTGSANGGAHNCRPEAGVGSGPRSIHDLKSRNDIQRLPGQRLDRPGGRKPYVPKGSVPSPSPRPPSSEATQAPSPLPLAQPLTPPVRRLELLPNSERPGRWPDQPEGHQRLAGPGCKAGLPPAEPPLLLPRAGLSLASSRADSDAAFSGGSESRKKKQYRPRDYTVNLDGQGAEAGNKPVKLKERKLTFDPMTRQIKPLTQKERVRAESPVRPEPPRTGLNAQEPKGSLQSPFEQTSGKELSHNEMIQPYPSRQSSLLSSSGAQTPGAHHLRQEESTRQHSTRETRVLMPHSPPADLPGCTREVTEDDLKRIEAHKWPGVNGCYDTQGTWYDWTQCIPLDPHGDGGILNILPYVCLE